MARTNKAPPAAPADQADTPKLAKAMEVARQGAAAAELVVFEHNARVTALARSLNYQGAIDASTLENSAREAIRRIGMGIFELGAYLLLLREACEHGSFLPALERLNIEVHAAQRYMRVTRRFAANATSSSHLESMGMSRLVELLPLDDEQLDELTDIGQTGELKLDDVASMSVKQLREKVRELRQDKTAVEEVLSKKNQRIDKLEAEKRRFGKLPPDDVLKKLLDEANTVMLDARGCIHGQLRAAVLGIQSHAEAHDGNRSAHDTLLAGLVSQLIAALKELQAEALLPDVSSAADSALLGEVAQWDKKK